MVDFYGDVNLAVEMWNTLFTEVANKHAPIKKTRIKGVKTPWMTSDLKNATAKKSNSTITSIEAGGVLYTDTNEIAQALNTYFSRIGTKLAAKIKEKLRLIT